MNEMTTVIDLHVPLPLATWLTPAAIARATGLAESRVRRWVAAGRIRAWRAPSGHYLIDPGAVAALLGEITVARSALGPLATIKSPLPKPNPDRR